MLVAGARLTSQPNAASASPASNRAAIRVGPDRLNEAMRQGVEFLNRASQSDGQFLYRVNLNPKVEVKPKYNFLRHAGTIYALDRKSVV